MTQLASPNATLKPVTGANPGHVENTLEIVFTNGRKVRIGGSHDPEALAIFIKGLIQ